MIIGVLALQGGVDEHLQMLEELGVSGRKVRLARDLEGIDGIILPGGESSVMDKLARALDLAEPLRQRIAAGLPVLATCAGLIYTAKTVDNPAPGQQTLGVLDITVHRNAFGSQKDSFDTALDVTLPTGVLEKVQASFIRAPEVISCGEGVTPIARLNNGAVVGAMQGNVLALSFHPEESGDSRVHQAWINTLEKVSDQ
ncbi:pyridoxal 5'-phosphate synthase glutaminase subunit PdxT [Corynebacterium callunae]|uniref:pyridoxal 5'-phosphate synthase glutaminase subunit PdxT n=1 Tax=Corynebacterium callunae TaxID=1721 RepID=UPI003982816C